MTEPDESSPALDCPTQSCRANDPYLNVLLNALEEIEEQIDSLSATRSEHPHQTEE